MLLEAAVAAAWREDEGLRVGVCLGCLRKRGADGSFGFGMVDVVVVWAREDGFWRGERAAAAERDLSVDGPERGFVVVFVASEGFFLGTSRPYDLRISASSLALISAKILSISSSDFFLSRARASCSSRCHFVRPSSPIGLKYAALIPRVRFLPSNMGNFQSDGRSS